MVGQKIGYARVSSVDQDFQIQVDALENVGCHKIFTEKKSGTSKNGRTELEICLNYLRDGDTLIVTRIDRLARSLRDLQNIVHDLKERGIDIQATEQQINTQTAAGKAFINMLGTFAEFETSIRKERQLEGIAKAKSKGVYKGRKPTAIAKSARVKEMIDDGFHKQEIADRLEMSLASVYRIYNS